MKSLNASSFCMPEFTNSRRQCGQPNPGSLFLPLLYLYIYIAIIDKENKTILSITYTKPHSHSRNSYICSSSMACYVDEEEVWKCPKHPSKRRRNGICPTCLRDRLVSLCPDCANVRPCACVVSTTSSSSSSSSSLGRVSNLIDGEPSFRRSRSVAIPFLRSKNTEQTPNNGRVKTPSFLSVLKRSKTKRSEPTKEKNEGSVVNGSSNCDFDSHDRIEDFARMVTRSRSVSAGTTAMASGFRRVDVSSSPAKSKFWHFPSPMKAFRSSKTPKVLVHDRSPLHRG